MQLRVNTPETPQVKSFARTALQAAPRVALGVADTFVASTGPGPLPVGMGVIKLGSAAHTLLAGNRSLNSAERTRLGGDIVAAAGLFMAGAGAGPASAAVTAAGEAIGVFGTLQEYYA